MFDPLSGQAADQLDIEELARTAYAKRLRLTTSSGLSGTAHLGGDPDKFVHSLLRLAAIGQAFVGASAAEPGLTLRSVRDRVARIGDERVVALLEGRSVVAAREAR